MKEILLNYYIGNRVFVIGTYASGKTLFTEYYSNIYNIPIVCVDNTLDISIATNPDSIKQYLDAYPDTFICDSIPYVIPKTSPQHPDYSPVLDFIENKSAKVICLVCSNPVMWLNRLLFSKKFSHLVGGLKDDLFIDESGKQREFNIDLATKRLRQSMLTSVRHYSEFYYQYLPQFTKCLDIDILDTSTHSLITQKELYQRIQWANPKLIQSYNFNYNNYL